MGYVDFAASLTLWAAGDRAAEHRVRSVTLYAATVTDMSCGTPCSSGTGSPSASRPPMCASIASIARSWQGDHHPTKLPKRPDDLSARAPG